MKIPDPAKFAILRLARDMEIVVATDVKTSSSTMSSPSKKLDLPVISLKRVSDGRNPLGSNQKGFLKAKVMNTGDKGIFTSR
jgi:hypothetical protein